MKKISCFLILSSLIIFSCKKYPDGPTFSFRSPSQRIIGAWKLKAYMVNGNDSINKFSNYTAIPGMDLKDPGINDTSGYLIRGGVDSNLFVSNIGLYELKNKKTELVLTIITYKILRLKQDELWLQTDYSGSSYELHYER